MTDTFMILTETGPDGPYTVAQLRVRLIQAKARSHDRVVDTKTQAVYPLGNVISEAADISKSRPSASERIRRRSSDHPVEDGEQRIDPRIARMDDHHPIALPDPSMIVPMGRMLNCFANTPIESADGSEAVRQAPTLRIRGINVRVKTRFAVIAGIIALLVVAVAAMTFDYMSYRIVLPDNAGDIASLPDDQMEIAIQHELGYAIYRDGAQSDVWTRISPQARQLWCVMSVNNEDFAVQESELAQQLQRPVVDNLFSFGDVRDALLAMGLRDGGRIMSDIIVQSGANNVNGVKDLFSQLRSSINSEDSSKIRRDWIRHNFDEIRRR